MNNLYAGENAAAQEMYDKALPFFVKADEPLGQGNVYQGKGDIYLRTGDNAAAQEMYDKALALYKRIGDIESEAYTQFRMAGISGFEGRKDEAVSLYEDALARIEKVREKTGIPEMKRTFMEKVYDRYEEAAIFMLNNSYNPKAFQWTEAMKARVFLDQLAEGLVDLEKGISPGFKEKRDTIEERLSMLSRQKMNEAQKKKPDNKRIDVLQAEIEKEEAALEEVKRQIRLKNPLYASVEYPVPITLSKLRKKILKKEEAILEYLLSKEGVYCFVITTDQFEIVRLSERKPIQDEVERFLGIFKVKKERIKGFDINSTKTAHNLYKSLIKPLESYIKDKTLIIIPDGILASLPFETLVGKDDKGRFYLLERYRIKYVQSATVLALLKTEYKRDGLSERFVGFGDPVYDYESFKAGRPEEGSDIKGKEGETAMARLTRSGYLRAGGKMNRLEISGEEVKAIEAIFRKKDKVEKGYLRLEAREEYAKADEMERYGYIHYSVHGVVNDQYQAIALSQIPDAREDGFLTLVEVMNSRYNARLVVLAACDSGLGKTERGEGVTGLTRAVMYAGSPAVVVSLWKVSEQGTRDLMVRFYENMMIKGMDKGEALRQAKREMIKSGHYNHPFFWSAFVMYGE